MTSIATSFDSIAQLVEIIKALKPFGKTVNYQKIDSFRDELGIVDSRSLLNQLTKQLMLEENTDLVKFIFDDMEYDNYPVPTLAAVAALHVMDPYHSSTTQVDNFKLLLSIIISRNISISDTLADNSDDLFDYYSSNPIPEIVDLIVLNLGDFRLQDLQKSAGFLSMAQLTPEINGICLRCLMASFGHSRTVFPLWKHSTQPKRPHTNSLVLKLVLIPMVLRK